MISKPECVFQSTAEAVSSLNWDKCLSLWKAQHYFSLPAGVLGRPGREHLLRAPCGLLATSRSHFGVVTLAWCKLVTEVKGSIARNPGKCCSAGPDVCFYFHCSSIANPSHVRGDKLSGIPGVTYLCSPCPPRFFSWAHTTLHTSYSLEKLFTTGMGIRDGDSLTVFLSPPELPLHQHPEHGTETQSGPLPTAVSCWLHPSATWQLQWEETGLRQKLSYEKVLSPYLFFEGSLLPEKPQLFSKGGISAASCDSSDRWKTSAYLFH